MTSFADLGLDPALVEALEHKQITEPTPIQEAAIPELLAGRDVVGQARTGSGKTLAFVLPLLQRCDPAISAPQALVLVPTRELAGQVAEVVDNLAPATGLRAAQIYGGRDMAAQLTLLHSGPQIVIGTPGRMLDHLYKGSLSFRHLHTLILDEADQMLDVGFAPDVERIFDCTSGGIQVALFSATMPDWVSRMISHRLHDPARAAVDEEHRGPTETVEHIVIETPLREKLDVLRWLLDHRGDGTVLVFARTKLGVEQLGRQLASAGYPAAAMQGNMGQADRERVLRHFRRGDPPILVATNVAARGLDIASVEGVINADVPESAELLVHRLGRTGRMGRSGDAVTLLTPAEYGKWKRIEKQLGIRIRHLRWIDGEPREIDETERGRAHAVSPARSESTVETGAQTARKRASGSRRRNPVRSGHEIVCAECGQNSLVPVAPRANRPVYCSDCYRKRKESSAA